VSITHDRYRKQRRTPVPFQYRYLPDMLSDVCLGVEPFGTVVTLELIGRHLVGLHHVGSQLRGGNVLTGNIYFS
jgi:hypothetical protein